MELRVGAPTFVVLPGLDYTTGVPEGPCPFVGGRLGALKTGLGRVGVGLVSRPGKHGGTGLGESGPWVRPWRIPSEG